MCTLADSINVHTFLYYVILLLKVDLRFSYDYLHYTGHKSIGNNYLIKSYLLNKYSMHNIIMNFIK
jgi:hypothetical protein